MGGALRPKYAFWLSVIYLLHLLPWNVDAADKAPNVKRWWAGNELSSLLYFDDSETILVAEASTGVVFRSSNEGLDWNEVSELGQGKVVMVTMSQYATKTAIAFSRNQTHWITKDRGESWTKFEIDGIPAFQPGPLLSFHADDVDRMIMNIITRDGPQAVYTEDGFETKAKVLRTDALRCLWAKEQEHFKSGKDTTDKDRTLCVVPGKYSKKQDAQRLLISDDFFKHESEPGLEDDRPVAGIVSVVAEKAFVLAARKTEGTNEMALYVSTDTKKWHRALFGGHQLKQGGYTVMESTNYSLQVDVATSAWNTPPMGSLFTSNSLGYSFVENEHHTNRNSLGYVDFEKITNIQGIVIVNIVANAEDVINIGAYKKIQSKISFDDGRTFSDLKVDGEDKTLHLHSVTEPSNVGKVFSSMAPGIAMGVGNTGSQLQPYGEGDLYVSDDAGLTWKKALSGPHKYEFGQGSILLAIADLVETDEMSYSLDHGDSWKTISFNDYPKLQGGKGDVKILPYSLTTLPDSTSLKFHLKASGKDGPDSNYYIYTIDFATLDLRECKSDDFEDWYARKTKGGEAKCIMGHTQKFQRRKADEKCFIGKKFKDAVPVNEDCPCGNMDYECDEAFKRSSDGKQCDRIEPKDPPAGTCEKDDDTFPDESGFRIIPGDTCLKGKGSQRDKEEQVQRKCKDAKGSAPQDGQITHKFTDFPADMFKEFYYREASASSDGNDETVIMLTDEGMAYITHDHGKIWKHLDLPTKEIVTIYPHRHIADQFYLITPSNTVYYSKERGLTDFKSFEAPEPPNRARIPIIGFHPKHEDWIIWTSCKNGGSLRDDCDPQAHVSTKNGAAGSWDLLKESVRGCEFVWRDNLPDGAERSEKLVYCMQHESENIKAPVDLISSDDWFVEHDQPLFQDMINFATMSEYIIVAGKEGKNSEFLKVDASIDGKEFADAKLPSKLRVHHSTAYTVLDSSTHSIFLHVTVNDVLDQQYGSIVKSNSNGTSYTMCLENVNRNRQGFVDFEKMRGLEGVAVANVVDNVDNVSKGEMKKLKTMITHNDGATWNLITPPEKDAEGNKYQCDNSKIGKCSLHLHGYTERPDPRDTNSSPSAVGLMIGVGNVGEYLKSKRDGDTFISSNGGMSWRTAKNGRHMWEFGDRGSLIVIVPEEKATSVVYYSQDEGKTWTEYQFSKDGMYIADISTVPSDTSRNFLLWGKELSGSKAATVNLDFSGLTSQKCQGVATPGTKKSDYYLWEPKHPDDKDNAANCLFGHISQYIRKKPDVLCYNPPNFPDALHKEIKNNCTCTRQDFECDYNYERKNDGTCKLVKGQKPRDGKRICANSNKVEWYEPTGYRKLKLSTCKGGKELEFLDDKKHACPGKEDAFKEKEGGIGAVGMFFAIVLPVSAAVAVGWWMWRNLDGRFGRIRLGEGGERAPALGNGSGRGSKILVKYPVMIVSGAVAVIMAVPMVLGVLWRSIRDRIPTGRRSYYSTFGGGANGIRPYTSRDSFSRTGRDYSDGPQNDERDLLGEESDEDT